jgi:hypothetical protein
MKLGDYMSEVTHIQVGATDGYRYTGVQPPLNERQLAALEAAAVDDPWMPTSFESRGSYSEAGFSSFTLEGHNGPDGGIVGVAQKVAAVLRTEGSDVFVDPTLHSIGHDRGLFSSGMKKG